jgi:hypothetical protein
MMAREALIIASRQAGLSWPLLKWAGGASNLGA